MKILSSLCFFAGLAASCSCMHAAAVSSATGERDRVAAIPLKAFDATNTPIAEIIERIGRQLAADVTFDDRAQYAERMDCHVENTNAADFLDALGKDLGFRVVWGNRTWQISSAAYEERYPLKNVAPGAGAAYAHDLRTIVSAAAARHPERCDARYDAHDNAFIVVADRGGQDAAAFFAERVDARSRPVTLKVSLVEADTDATLPGIISSEETGKALVELARGRGNPVTKTESVHGGNVRHFDFAAADGIALTLDVQPMLADSKVYLAVSAELRAAGLNKRTHVVATSQEVAIEPGHTMFVDMPLLGDARSNHFVVAITPTVSAL